ncbi:MAG: XTP/dITP diphosphatase [Actinomycetota bacterium]|nr:XTP/dITP diphosphatase [Actinomycetota bacterium]
MIRKRLVLATRNAGKIKELRDLLRDMPVDILTHRDLDGWPDMEETGDTFEENAAIKAETMAAWSGFPALADDSGLEVEALGGAPGVISARYSGSEGGDAANIAHLLWELEGIPQGKRGARFACVLTLAYPPEASLEVRDICEGDIMQEPRGEGGFGYDPVFLPRGMSRTMAELTREEKNAISHRGKALRRLRALLEAGQPAWFWEKG